MYLIVGSTPGSNSQHLLPLFEGAGCTVADRQQIEEWCLAAKENTESSDTSSRTSIHDLIEQVSSPAIFPVNDVRYLPLFQSHLTEFSDTNTLLFYSRPESVLAQAMEQGNEPEKALADWQDAAQQLMQAHRHNRRKSLMVDAGAALAAPDAFTCVCKERYGININSKAINQQEETVPREIYKVIAAQLVNQTAGLPQLLAEMEASSIPLTISEASPVVDCMQAYKEFQELKDQVNSKLEDTEQENELLLLQLHQVQEELESYYLQAQEESEKRQKTEKTVESQQKELKEKEKALAEAEKRLNLIQQSTSWRITAPLRGPVLLVKRLFRKSKPSGQKAAG